MQIIDVHNHSLPNIDDGAKSDEMALAMLCVAQQAGTTSIILTPHHLNGAFTNFADDVAHQTERLQRLAHENNISIGLYIGSEVHLVPETVEQLLNHKALTYCGLGKAALIELPKHSVPAGSERILSELIYHGITPVIAHPERNSMFRQDFSQLQDWVAFGCKTQVTGQSCCGEFGQETQSAVLKMIAEGIVHLVASDAHRPQGRSPDLRNAVQAIKEYFGDEVCETLFAENPRRIVHGETLLSVNVDASMLVNKGAKSARFVKSSKSGKKLPKSRKRTWLERLRKL